MAVIGGGPAGLTAAADLRSKGYGVTIFDAKPKLGGMLRYGIPEYRLPDEVLDHETPVPPGRGRRGQDGSARRERPQTPQDARPATVPARANSTPSSWPSAPGLSRKLGIPGEDAPGVWPGLKFLHDVNTGAKPALGQNVLVIGGGDVAMDAARCARRLPGVKSVHLACLEKREEMPAHSWEAAEALEEGVEFHSSLGPTKIETENGKVTGVAFRACTRVFDENERFCPAVRRRADDCRLPPTR